MSDDGRYVIKGNGAKRAYHAREDCGAVEQGTRPRSEHYIEWHDLEPCERCHDTAGNPVPNDVGDSVGACERCGDQGVQLGPDGHRYCDDCRTRVERPERRVAR